VEALEQVWAAIRRHHPELPQAVVVTGPGSDPRRAELVRLGHFAADRWRGESGAALPEVFVGGEGLARAATEVFATLLHEAAHALARARGIKDTSRQGRYHNRRFQAIAEELGLDVELDERRGFARTSLPPATARRYASAIDHLAGALHAYRELEPAARGERRGRNRLRCSCTCPRKIWVSPTTLAAGPIACGVCGQPFSPSAA
jgi:hypothetical protein